MKEDEALDCLPDELITELATCGLRMFAIRECADLVNWDAVTAENKVKIRKDIVKLLTAPWTIGDDHTLNKYFPL
jgi:hypothetical protein